MKKKRKMYLCFTAVVLSLLMGIGVQAATNPFGKIPVSATKNIVSSLAWIGPDYVTPRYSQKIKMKVTSSNKKVADVKVFDCPKDEYNNGWAKSFGVRRKGYGTTYIKATVTVGKKTYKKTFKYTFYKYKNPFSEFKINGKKYTSKLNKMTIKKSDGAWYYGKPIRLGEKTGKLSYKLKKGYKITDIWIHNESTSKMKKIKNNQKIPKGYKLLYIYFMDTKTKAKGCITFI